MPTFAKSGGIVYICSIMKKVLIIAVAALCVMSCGQRKAAKSQEAEKAAPQETVEQASCCGGSECSPAEAVAKECDNAAKQTEEMCKTVDKAVKEATATMKKQAEAAQAEAENVEQLGRKADPKPIKPVPKPKK